MHLILIINAGSSSVKCALMRIKANGQTEDCARGQVDGLGHTARFTMRFNDGHDNINLSMPSGTNTAHKDALGLILKTVEIGRAHV